MQTKQIKEGQICPFMVMKDGFSCRAGEKAAKPV